MATKATVKKNPRWLVLLEDIWANNDDHESGPAGKAELLELLNDLPGFNVVKVTKQPQVAK